MNPAMPCDHRAIVAWIRRVIQRFLSVAIAQRAYATDASGEIQVLSQLQEAVELDGVLVQPEALNSNYPSSSTSLSAAPIS
jgi:hypothetical protein